MKTTSAICCLYILFASVAHAQSSYYIHAGQIVDVTEGRLLSDLAIVGEGDRITVVRTWRE